MTVIVVHNAYTAITVIIVPAVACDGLRFHFFVRGTWLHGASSNEIVFGGPLHRACSSRRSGRGQGNMKLVVTKQYLGALAT